MIQTKETVYRLKSHIAMEYFEGGVLLLDLLTRKTISINGCGGWLLRRLDGRNPLSRLATDYATMSALSPEEGFSRIRQSCKELLETNLIIETRDILNGAAMKTTRYIQNPDVNLREEDEEGALLFNPDTDRVQLLNRTGFFIWSLCRETRTVKSIIDAFHDEFDEVPEDEVKADVKEFLDRMIESGFIGIVEEPSE